MAGKKFTAAAAKVTANKQYNVDEAFALVCDTKIAKFDESVDCAIRLGVDPKSADQMVRGAVVMPNGTGKTMRVICFAKGEKELEAQKAGADHVGGDELADKVLKEEWMDFDVVVSTPDMMKTVSKLGKLLGPRGLMPNPKTGTVTFDVGAAVKAAKAGRVEYRTEKAGIVHSLLGKSSMGGEKLKENFLALMDALIRAKPATSKGTYLRSITLSTTMGPGIQIDPNSVVRVAAK